MSAPAFQQRKAVAMNREIKRLLGSSYSWDEELYYFGNPLSNRWQTEGERKVISALERNWREATTA